MRARAHTLSSCSFMFCFQKEAARGHMGEFTPLPLTFHRLMSSPVFPHSFPCWRVSRGIRRFCSGVQWRNAFPWLPPCKVAAVSGRCHKGGNGSGHDLTLGGELEAPMSLRKAAMSPLPLPKGSINTHLFIQQMFLRSLQKCGSLEHRLEIGEIWP